jgi:MFS family permease
VSRLLPDLAPWRSSRDFRLLWCASAVTVFGNFLTFVAVPVQVKELTGSTLAVGTIGAVQLVPLIVFGLYGGTLADAFDRRKLIIYTEAALALLSALLLANSLLPHPLLWPLYVISALGSALSGLQRPALDSIVPRIVPHDQLTAAAALNALRWQIGGVVAPSLAGILVAFGGLEWAYATDTATFAISIALSSACAPPPPPTTPASRPCDRSPKAPATPGAARICSASTPSTWPRPPSPSPSPSSRFSPTTWTRPGPWA